MCSSFFPTFTGLSSVNFSSWVRLQKGSYSLLRNEIPQVKLDRTNEQSHWEKSRIAQGDYLEEDIIPI